MNESLPDGTLKLAVARDLLAQHLQAFRPETHIGLRAYGHRIHYNQAAESCQDIELIAPVETGQLPVMVAWLQRFQAQGMTPLAESIRQAMEDFVFEPPRINSIVMLSDGIETCEGDPCGLVRGLKAQGFNFTIHVIGLDVDQETRDQLTCIAYTSGGTYHDARSAQELRDALNSVGAEVTLGEMITDPLVDTPAPGPPTATEVAQVETPTPAPTPEPTVTLILPTPTGAPTEAPSATPVPPSPTPTAPARVLSQPIQNKYAGDHVQRGVTTAFGEDYRASYDKTIGQVTTCQEESARSESEVEVVCRQSFTDPEWSGAEPYTQIWNVWTGVLVGREGHVIPDGVGTETTTVSLASQEFQVFIRETSYRDEWVFDGNNWWEDVTCTLYEHANNMTVRWACHGDGYVLFEDATHHIFSHDWDIRLVETNLDL
jgi:hypothetical protein